MVEYALDLDTVFGSLADSTRRDILRRLDETELSIGDLADYYSLSYGAISKHVLVLEKAQLVLKRRRGKQQLVRLSKEAFVEIYNYLEWYQKHLDVQFNNLDRYLKKEAS